MKPHFLYRITVAGRSYIGVTNDPSYRFGCHRRAPSLIGDAIRAAGCTEAKLEILCSGSYHYVRDLERRAIVAFNTMLPSGYNLAPGGHGGTTPEHGARIAQRRAEWRAAKVSRECRRSEWRTAAKNAANRAAEMLPTYTIP